MCAATCSCCKGRLLTHAIHVDTSSFLSVFAALAALVIDRGLRWFSLPQPVLAPAPQSYSHHVGSLNRACKETPAPASTRAPGAAALAATTIPVCRLSPSGVHRSSPV